MIEIAKAPGGGMYQFYISSEPCDGGFKATVDRVLLMLPKSPVGSDVPVGEFPELIGATREAAEAKAVEYFKKVWVGYKKLGI